MKLNLLAASATLALASLAVHAPAAHAQALPAGNAVAFCQSSLPTADVNIRKSPIFVANQGSTSSFVTCSLPANGGGNNDYVAVYLNNTKGTDTDVSCTMVDGVSPVLFGAEYYPQTVTVPANDANVADWDATDLGVTFSNVANVNCLVPPGIQLLLVGASAPAP